jgi:hypothetical protein
VLFGRLGSRRYLAHSADVCLEEVSAGELAALVPLRDQAPQVDRDVIGLAVVCILYLFWRHGPPGKHRHEVRHHTCGVTLRARPVVRPVVLCSRVNVQTRARAGWDD